MAASLDAKIVAFSASVFAAAAGLLSFAYYASRSKKENWVKVGTLDEIFIFPFKGGKAISVPTAFMSFIGARAGPFLDRAFMVIDGK